MPAFCRVTGSIKPSADSDIRFELWLPAEGWNGRFMQTGNGGAAGSIVYDSFVDPLVRGYAVANTDRGIQGAGGDFAWALDHPEKVTDYAYRAVHELTIAGKAITTARYGRSPEKAYWNGCSTGRPPGVERGAALSRGRRCDHRRRSGQQLVAADVLEHPDPAEHRARGAGRR